MGSLFTICASRPPRKDHRCMSVFDFTKPQAALFRIALALGMAALTLSLAAFAYLGTFTRYLADDYCEAVLVTKSSPFSAVINRYVDSQWRAADQYSNLLLIGLSERLIRGNCWAAPAFMFFFCTPPFPSLSSPPPSPH